MTTPTTFQNSALKTMTSSNHTNLTGPIHSAIHLGTKEIIAICPLVIVFIVGTIGNGLVIYVFGWKRRRRRKRFESLLLILAVIDFLASLVIPVLFIYGTATRFKHWHFGYYGCKIFTSLFPVTITISQGVLVLISFERYKSIVNPLGEKISQKIVYGWLLMTLVVALILVSPFTYSLQLVSDKQYGINTCIPSGERFSILYIYSVGTFFRDLTATCGMVTLGYLSTKTLRKGQALLTGRGVAKRLENTNKACKMFLTVVCVFCVCVIPVDLFQICIYTLVVANVKYSSKVYGIILISNTFLTILQITNSATNIFVYSKMHRGFARSLFACVRKGNDYIRDSISRVTFRGTRSESFTSTSGGLLNFDAELK